MDEVLGKMINLLVERVGFGSIQTHIQDCKIIDAGRCVHTFDQKDWYHLSMSLETDASVFRILSFKCEFFHSNQFILGLQVGQAHGGLLGLIQKSCMQTSRHVLFERSEMKDRHLVRKK